MGKPSAKLNPVANQYAGPEERIIEYTDHRTGLGGLISIRRHGDDTLSVDLYAHDPGVTIRVGEARVSS